MPILFLFVGEGKTSWSLVLNKKTGKYIKVVPPSYQISVGTDCEEGLDSPYGKWYRRSWYQGSWFIDNPMENMPRDEFIKVMTSINQTIMQKYPSNKDKPVFTGKTFMEIYPNLVKCMEEIIELLKNKTGNDDWTYREAYGCNLKQQLMAGDKFANAWC